jgi:uncharacterized protein (DUF58 family)
VLGPLLDRLRRRPAGAAAAPAGVPPRVGAPARGAVPPRPRASHAPAADSRHAPAAGAERAEGAAARAVPAEVLRQVRYIELRTKGLVNSLFAGEYRSVFKGQGMEFAEVREYQPGDDVRAIDWNVTARMRRPFVRRYEEERELTVMLVVDLSGSERFGTARRFKDELAVELAAVLALAAVRNNDRVGLVLFTDRVEHVVRPRKGRRHALRLLRDLLAADPVGTGHARRARGRVRGLAARPQEHRVPRVRLRRPDLERPLKRLALRHDVVAVTVGDPGERALPDVGLAAFVDPRPASRWTSTRATPACARVRRGGSDRARGARAALPALAIDEVPVRTDGGYVEPLLKFFRSRETRAGKR